MPAAVKQASFSGVGAKRMLTEAPVGVSKFNALISDENELATCRVSIVQSVNEICGSKRYIYDCLLYYPPLLNPSASGSKEVRMKSS